MKRRLRRGRRFQAHAHGFTLLEVMIALAIFATLASAVLAASQYSVRQSARLHERLLCAWVADNQLSELRVQPVSPGRQQLLRRFDGREWRVEQTVTAAADPRLQQVDISVSRSDSDQPIYSISAWIPARHE
ncbi:type II secretion system minor pseudopilin GspI [Pseudomonas reactans]|uniref:type II secretion system minor pseudopilin GspI n=1 Tax=Pseudomonas reactans TaxID=117680 RepID=UPI002483E8F1|nr:type II secretion system minor pseudopilin GspI [Pseudomonas reactans]